MEITFLESYSDLPGANELRVDTWLDVPSLTIWVNFIIIFCLFIPPNFERHLDSKAVEVSVESQSDRTIVAPRRYD